MGKRRPINRSPFRRPPWRLGKAGEKGWLSGFTAGTDWNAMPVRGTADAPGTPWQVSVPLIDGAELSEHEDNLKVVRTLGECHWLMDSSSQDGCLVRVGVLAVQARVDVATSTEVTDYISPCEVDEIDKSWLYLNTVYVPRPKINGPDGPQPPDAVRVDIDIKSTRRLRADARLLLFMEAQYAFKNLGDPIAESPLHFTANLRHFITF